VRAIRCYVLRLTPMGSCRISWLFFKARPARNASRSDAGGAKCPYLNHTGRASNAEKQPTGHQRGVFLCGIPASRLVIQDIERNCSTSGGLGIRSTKAIILAWDSAIGYVSGAVTACRGC
jgi:hypothetical protein